MEDYADGAVQRTPGHWPGYAKLAHVSPPSQLRGRPSTWGRQGRGRWEIPQVSLARLAVVQGGAAQSPASTHPQQPSFRSARQNPSRERRKPGCGCRQGRRPQQGCRLATPTRPEVAKWRAHPSQQRPATPTPNGPLLLPLSRRDPPTSALGGRTLAGGSGPSRGKPTQVEEGQTT